MNEYLEENDGGEHPSFKDPLFYDTELTEQGVSEAREAASTAAGLQPVPQLIVSSPLQRALHTADLTFPNTCTPRLALSLARERTYFSSDVGQPRCDLERQWPHWSFDGVPDNIWWLDHSEEKGDPQAIIKESKEHFQERMKALQRYLCNRSEDCIALVTHRDVIENLAGTSPKNCQFLTIKLELAEL